MTNAQEKAPLTTAAEVTQQLLMHLRSKRPKNMTIPNVCVGYSPWESDVISVTEAGYWTEYEVKVSIADYRADFSKRLLRETPNTIAKHDGYGSSQPIMWGSSVVPKPKQFYFAVPAGLLDAIEVPPHCGIINVTRSRWGLGVRVARQAPILSPAARLSASVLFQLGRKASHKIPPPLGEPAA